MRYYCTYFDHNYLPRGLALYESLRRHAPDFELWVLCLSRQCHEWLTQRNLPGIRAIALDEFERADPELLRAKQNRSIVEYYFTCSPSLPLFVFAQAPQANLVTYLDSDLYFFRDPEPVFAEMGARSIAIIAHRFPPALRHLEETGVYNVGWVSFRRDAAARACLDWWRARCLEWCYDRMEPGRYADQKYLDQWPALFQGVATLANKGANLAPWNLANYQVRFRDGRVRVDDDELVFFHFHGFQPVNRWLYDPRLKRFGARPTHAIRRHVFLPYWQALQCAQRHVQSASSSQLVPEGLRHVAREGQPAAPSSAWQQAWAKVSRWHRLSVGVLKQRYVLVWPWQADHLAEPAAEPLEVEA
jgi:hypothetical protein